jgi:hypothetical protein
LALLARIRADTCYDTTTDDAETEMPEERGTPTLQADTVEVKVGKCKAVGKVKRAEINPHGFVDFECTGIERMRKKNLMVARHRKRERNRRRQKALEATLLNQGTIIGGKKGA